MMRAAGVGPRSATARGVALTSSALSIEAAPEGRSSSDGAMVSLERVAHAAVGSAPMEIVFSDQLTYNDLRHYEQHPAAGSVLVHSLLYLFLKIR